MMKVNGVAAAIALFGVTAAQAQQEPEVPTTTVEIFGTVVGGEFAGTEGVGSITFSQPEILLPPPPEFPGGEEFPFGDFLIGIEDGFPGGEGPPFFEEIAPFGPLDLVVLDLEFTIFGQTFTEENDIDFPGGPFLFIDFETGELNAIDFIVSEAVEDDEFDINTTEIEQDGVFEFSFGLPFGEDDFPIDIGFPPDFFDGENLFAVANADGPSITVDVIVNGVVAEVPLPATAWLLIAGLGGLGLYRARKA